MLDLHHNLSCVQCRKKKIRCDLEEPCTRCLKGGMGAECVRLLRRKRLRQPRRGRSQASAGSSTRSHDSTSATLQSRDALPMVLSDNPLPPGRNHSVREDITTAVHLLQSLEICEKLLRGIYVSVSFHFDCFLSRLMCVRSSFFFAVLAHTVPSPCLHSPTKSARHPPTYVSGI